MRHVLLSLVLLVSAAPLLAHDFIRYHPPAGSGGGGLSFPLNAGDGCTTPPYSFTSDTDMGLCRGLAATWGFDSLVLQTSTYGDFTGAFIQLHESGTDLLGLIGGTAASGDSSTYYFQTPIAGLLYSNYVLNASNFTTGAGSAVNLEGNAHDDGTGFLRFTVTDTQAGTIVSTTNFLGDRTTFSDPILLEDGGTQPTCAVGVQGMVWRENIGISGQGDTMEVCRDIDGEGTYEWTTLQPTFFDHSPLKWELDLGSTTATDPGTGLFKLNNLSQTSATAIYVDSVSAHGRNIDDLMGMLGSGDRLALVEQEGGGNQLHATLSGAPTDNSGWWTIPVTIDASGAGLVDNREVGFAAYVGLAAGSFVEYGSSQSVTGGVDFTSDGTVAFTANDAGGQVTSISLNADTPSIDLQVEDGSDDVVTIGVNVGSVEIIVDNEGSTTDGASLLLDDSVAQLAALGYTSSDVTVGATVDRGVRIETSASKPTCDSSNRGYMWRTEGGASVADTFEVCLKDSSDVYAWVALATP